MVVIPTLGGGGAERVARDLIGEFVGRGIEVTLLLFSRQEGYGVPEGVRTLHLDIEEAGGFVPAISKFITLVSKLRKTISEERPAHVLGFMDYTNIALIIAGLLADREAKIAGTVHISPTLHFHTYARNAANRLLSAGVRLLYKKAFRIITVSEFIRKDLIDNYGMSEKNVVTIYNPVQLEKIRTLAEELPDHPFFREGTPVIIAAGRLTRQKGFDHLLSAFELVRRRTDANLVILGEGEDAKILKEMSVRLGVAGSVAFLGFQSNPYAFMRHSSVYVLSSLYEGFPMVVLEAMACGVPVVSTVYNPGSNEVIEHEATGLLVPPADAQALAQAILRLLEDRALGKALANAARQRVELLSVERIAQQYEDVLFGD